ncbi:S-layer homology domain-containing protein [Paenibacillus sp. Soil766]|uniref:S-layer homology domain-containing protein n=1 Tax=Paenibacillus sp. Soil766 TaxID=1736404 RepID=UPI001F2A0191|nr:S-layer homology domain-containing protein [Paenibacillus sp. Soil766]
MFKKLSMTTISIMLVSILFVAAGAWAADAGVKHTAEADSLNKLQLFQGTDRGYELDQTLTRAQGATMLLRLFGWEAAAANAQGLSSPFTDVPATHWAAKSVGFAFSKALVHGVTDVHFAPDASITGEQFLALTLRALGYAEAEPQMASELAATSGLLSASEAQQIAQGAVFRRDEMVAVAYRAIQTKLKGSTRTLLQKLVEDDKAVSAEAAVASGLYKTPSTDPMDQIEAAIRDALK